MTELVTGVGILTGLALAFAVLLAAASVVLRVDEDPRLGKVTDMLPGTNCGACGQPGCAAFARALVAGEAAPGGCTVSSPPAREAVAAFLGIDVGAVVERVARLRCAGSEGRVGQLAEYHGLSTCRGASMVGGGGRACAWGCLGLGDCEVACDFSAITMARGLPHVDPVACTACGDCVTACPLDLFEIAPLDHALHVACASPLTGEDARSRCRVACDGCGRCAADAPPGVIEMVDGLPRIHWSAERPTERATWRCPTGAIVWQPESPARRSHAS